MHDDRQGVRGAGGGRSRGWAAIGLLALLFCGAWFASHGTPAEAPVLLLAAAGLLVLGFLGFGSVESLFRRAEQSEQREQLAVEHLETLRATCGEGVLVLNEEGVVLSLNAAAEQIFGYPPHEARGSRIQMLLADLEVRDGSPALAREMVGRRRDGVEVQLEIELSPRASDGVRYLVLRDSGRLRAAEALARAAEEERRKLSASALEAILVFDREGRIQEANPSAEKLLGKSWSHLSGKDLADTLLPRDLRPAFKRDLREIATGGTDRIHGRDEILELWITGRPAIRARVAFALTGGRWFAFVQPIHPAADGDGRQVEGPVRPPDDGDGSTPHDATPPAPGVPGFKRLGDGRAAAG